MRQVTVTSQNGALLFDHQSRDGGCILFNEDVNNTVWLGKDASIAAPPIGQSYTIPLTPQSWMALDGEEDVYGVCATGQSVVVNVIDGGQSFFQSGITSGGFQIGPQGLFIYATKTPGFGTPPIFSATPPFSNADPFGNPVVADAVTTYNAFGAAINILSMAKGAFFQYRDLGSATQGILILSVASVASTDPFGNNYPVGMFGEDPFGNAIQTVGSSINLFNALIGSSTGGRISIAAAPNPPGNTNPYIKVDAPEQVAAGHMQMLLQGTSPDGTQPGQALIGQVSGAGGLLTPQTNAMLEVQSNVGGNNPQLQLISLAVPNNWLSAKVTGDANNRLRIDSGGGGVGRPKFKAGAGVLTQDTIFANNSAGVWATDQLIALVGGSGEVPHSLGNIGFGNLTLNVDTYQLLPDGRVFISLKAVAAGAITAATFNFTNTLPVAYRPSTTTDLCVVLPGGATTRLTIATTGVVSLTLPALVSGNRVICQQSYDLQ